MRSAPEVLFEYAEAWPDRVRFLDPDVTLGELAARVRSVATWLVERGVQPGDHVAIQGDNRLEWAIAAWAVQAAGAAFVSIHATCSPEQAGFIVRDSRARLLIADRGEPDLHLDALPEDHPHGALPQGDPHARACLIYTSGTTGDPKGVVLTHANLWANGLDWLEVLGELLPANPVELHWLPMSHIFGWGALCIGTVRGFATRLCSYAEVHALLPRVRPHLLMAVPLVWDHLPPEATGGRLRLGLSGAAPLNPDTKRAYAEAGLLLLEGYGLTETSPTLTLERPGRARFDTVGPAYPSVELALADDGEVLARGPSVFQGYWGAPPSDPGDWFHTGDLGRFVDGSLQLIGRKKELIVLAGGKKVAPAAVESRWQGPGRLVVLGEGQRHLRGLLFSPDEVDVERWLPQLNRGLARHEQLRSIQRIPELPSVDNGLLTPSLKLKRHRVRERYLHGDHGATS